jgi:DNA-binding SARP family transcriptional activator
MSPAQQSMVRGAHRERPGSVWRSTNRAPPSIELSLLDGFELRSAQQSVPLAPNAQRLLALLALRGHSMLRVHVAGLLWTDSSEKRAYGNLRSLLWRLPRPRCDLVETSCGCLRLARNIRVDVHVAARLAHRLLAHGGDDPESHGSDWLLLGGVLLPDWYDEWVIVERERYRLLGLCALETLSEHLIASGCYGRALEAAVTAVVGDPLRESAHRTLMKVHLADGNVAEAVHQYHFFKDLLDARLGLEPSPQMRSMVTGFMPP